MSHEQDFNERQNTKKAKLKGCNFWLRSHNTTFYERKSSNKKNEFSMIPAHVRAAEVARTREWGSPKSLNLGESFKL